MTNKLFLDFETRSGLDLKKAGSWKYARHPSTQILCLAYSFGNGEAGVLSREEIAGGKTLILNGSVLVAHNVHFEYAIYHNILHKRFGWPIMSHPGLWDCTLARAAMCNLPLSLDKCGEALGVASKKDLHGKALMLKLCKPGAEETPELLKKLQDYCVQDVRAEMELDSRLPPLSLSERAVWEMDLIINGRGVQMDVKLAEKAACLAEKLTGDLNAKLNVLTGGSVSSASRVAEIKRYLGAHSIQTASLDKNSVTTMLENPEIPSHIKNVLAIRRQVGKTSTAKYAAVINVADLEDERARGLLQYHAAGTGRWGGRLIQPQNFPRGSNQEAQNKTISAIMADDKDVAVTLDDLSGALRGTIVASPGKRLVVADYSSIEARVILWLAGDEYALDKYRRGVNLYVDMAKFIYGRLDITKEGNPKEYAVAKAIVLGAGFGLGAERFRAQCLLAGVEISEADAVRSIRAYRDKYRSVVNMWYSVEKAAISAVKNPGSVHLCCGGKAAFGISKNGEYLCCRLPSGRHLRYYHPSTKLIDSIRGEKEEIHYWCAGISGALEEFKTYGGSLVENIPQAAARDIMANGMLRAESNGYPVVLTIHDELVTEVEDGTGSVEELIRLMCTLPEWAGGLPIAAEGWEGKRYRK